METEVKQIFGANFPKTADNRTYHVDTKRGEVANRIITVGDLGRAKMLAETFLDKANDLLNDDSDKKHIPKIFYHLSSRGFATYTGTYKGVPVTIIGTGMGYSMIDFSIRENAAIIEGSIVMVRLGTCGSIDPSANVGDVVVHEQSVMITRNPDAFRKANQESNVKKEIKIVEKQSSNELSFYRVSLPCRADEQLTNLLAQNIEKHIGKYKRGTNSSADSFYSSQGRLTNEFVDYNENLIKEVKNIYPELLTLEMETFHLFDLAENSAMKLYAAGACIVLAGRLKDEFLDLKLKKQIEKQLGHAALDALINFPLGENEIMNDSECVWHPNFVA